MRPSRGDRQQDGLERPATLASQPQIKRMAARARRWACTSGAHTVSAAMQARCRPAGVMAASGGAGVCSAPAGTRELSTHDCRERPLALAGLLRSPACLRTDRNEGIQAPPLLPRPEGTRKCRRRWPGRRCAAGRARLPAAGSSGTPTPAAAPRLPRCRTQVQLRAGGCGGARDSRGQQGAAKAGVGSAGRQAGVLMFSQQRCRCTEAGLGTARSGRMLHKMHALARSVQPGKAAAAGRVQGAATSTRTWPPFPLPQLLGTAIGACRLVGRNARTELQQ